LGHIFNSF